MRDLSFELPSTPVRCTVKKLWGRCCGHLLRGVVPYGAEAAPKGANRAIYIIKEQRAIEFVRVEEVHLHDY